MPIFEYKCRKCGHIQEIFCNAKNDTHTHQPCDKCGVTVWEKVPSRTNWVFGGELKHLK